VVGELTLMWTDLIRQAAKGALWNWKRASLILVAALAVLMIAVQLAGSGRAARARHQPPASPGAPAATTAPGGASPRPSPSLAAPAPRPPASPPASASGPGPGIYQWLPFTPAELTAAAAAATRFGALYGTFTYSESAAGYVRKMRSVVTAQLSQVLARAYATAGVAGPRARAKQVSAASARISSLRAFGSASITFVVAISQKITGAGGISRRTGQYAVTVTGSGRSWQVSDMQLASAGNS
jgi:hypothetical protein